MAPPDDVLAAFWDLARDLLAVADLDGQFLHVNARWKEVTGYTEEELCSRPFIEFVHPDDREQTIREAEQMAADGRDSISFENRYVCADGSVVWLRWNSYTAAHEERIYAVATDVTARRRSERCLEVMQRVAAASNQADDLDDALRSALDDVCDLTGWDAGHAYLPVEGQSAPHLRSSGLWSLAGTPERYQALRELTAETALAAGEDLPGRVWETGSPVWVEDVGELDWWMRGADGDLGIRAAFAFPVRSGDEVVAVLEFFSPEAAAPDAELLEVLDHVGTQVGRVRERIDSIEARQRAIEVERQFLSMLSHELRSPLMSIKGFTDLLLERWDALETSEKLEFLDRVGNSADRMHRMIEEFLVLARHQEHGFQPRFGTLTVAEEIDRAVREIGGALPAVEVNVPPDLTAHADRDFLQQILVNLVTNAERYGHPPIEIRAAETEDGVEVAVRDHGPGVPDEFVPHLFTRFAQADRDRGGTGLGLSICRDLAQAQGGDVHYEDATPGARFAVRLPRAATTTGDGVRPR